VFFGSGLRFGSEMVLCGRSGLAAGAESRIWLQKPPLPLADAMHCAWLEKPQLVPPLGYIAHQYAWAGMGAWIVKTMIASVPRIALERNRRVSDRGVLPWYRARKF